MGEFVSRLYEHVNSCFCKIYYNNEEYNAINEFVVDNKKKEMEFEENNRSFVGYIKSLMIGCGVQLLLFDKTGNEIFLGDPRYVNPYMYSILSDESKNYVEHIKDCINFINDNEIEIDDKKIQHNFYRYIMNPEFSLGNTNIRKYCKYFCDEECFLDLFVTNREESEKVLNLPLKDKSWMFRKSSVDTKKGESFALSLVVNGKISHILIEKIYGMGWKWNNNFYTDLFTCIETLMKELDLTYNNNISFFAN